MAYGTLHLRWLVILCCLGFVAASCVEKPSLVNAQLSGDVKIRGIELHLTNVESFPWKNVTIVLNDVYTHTVPQVGADATTVVPLREFVDTRGQRFSPLTLKALRVKVTATRASINGSLSGDLVDTH